MYARSHRSRRGADEDSLALLCLFFGKDVECAESALASETKRTGEHGCGNAGRAVNLDQILQEVLLFLGTREDRVFLER